MSADSLTRILAGYRRGSTDHALNDALHSPGGWICREEWIGHHTRRLAHLATLDPRRLP